VSPELVQAFIAGGDIALRNAVEGAEDNHADGQAVAEAVVSQNDVAVGISASGTAPWVLGAMAAARQKGAFTAGLVCCAGSPLAAAVDRAICVSAGPEVLAGSTRLKAGTAQKLVLNMLTTGSMIQLGKTYENLMIDVQPTNQKLKARATRLVGTLSGVSDDLARNALVEANYQVKPAVLMASHALSLAEAQALLATHQGKLKQALSALRG
jgi:N-acetylmuramic acid 6-phosphate etherase